MDIVIASGACKCKASAADQRPILTTTQQVAVDGTEITSMRLPTGSCKTRGAAFIV